MQNLQSNFNLLGMMAPSATLAISGLAKEMKIQGLDVCSMSAGEPDFDTPQVIKDSCIQAINEGKVRYLSSSGLPELKDEIIKKFAANGIISNRESIVISTGAKFAIFAAVMALCGKGDEVILFSPYWLSYPEIIKASGAEVVEVKTYQENNFTPTREDLEKALSPKTKLIIVNSPNNPTGVVYPLAVLEMIADVAVKYNIMVLSDEIYEKLIYDDNCRHYSIASLNSQIAPLTITVNGFSKAYAMTGWRLGYLTAPQWLVKRIAALQSHATSNATSFVQYAGIAALRGEADEEVAKMVEAFKERRDLICGLLQEIPRLEFVYPQGAFYVLCNIKNFNLNSDDFCRILLENSLVAAIPCKCFGAEGYIRLSYACSPEIIKKSVERLKLFCNGLI